MKYGKWEPDDQVRRAEHYLARSLQDMAEGIRFHMEDESIQSLERSRRLVDMLLDVARRQRENPDKHRSNIDDLEAVLAELEGGVPKWSS